jgi:photosystem II stability/assembly factor-like uncharacterized protein
MLKQLSHLFKTAILGCAVLVLCTACSFLPTLGVSPWEQVQLPTDSTVLDLSFANPQHGWLVGTHAALLETEDGGKTWQPRALELEEDVNYRFNSVSFKGEEGWISGEPGILLHTTDGGKSWARVPLSAKLPGVPIKVAAVGANAVEMTTDVGAIYKTEDGGRHWNALVQEAFGVLRNINRSADGQYVAVSSRGSFYSIWSPGETSWDPHNRNSSRRIQSMGFDPSGHLWMLARGGQIQFSNDSNEWDEPLNPDRSVSVGLLDMAFRSPEEIWVTGGSGTLLCSLDGGKTWQKDRNVADVPSNLYNVVFFGPNQGFVTGQNGVLLRYVG